VVALVEYVVYKKPSAVTLLNAVEKPRLAEIRIPSEMVEKKTKTTAQAIVKLILLKHDRLCHCWSMGSMPIMPTYSVQFLATERCSLIVEGSLGINTAKKKREIFTFL
jgi:hydroxymethylglutaryl-CoA reductase (NADPH)